GGATTTAGIPSNGRPAGAISWIEFAGGGRVIEFARQPPPQGPGDSFFSSEFCGSPFFWGTLKRFPKTSCSGNETASSDTGALFKGNRGGGVAGAGSPDVGGGTGPKLSFFGICSASRDSRLGCHEGNLDRLTVCVFS